MKLTKAILFTSAITLVTGCSLPSATSIAPETLTNHSVTAVQGSAACRKALGSKGANGGLRFLDSSQIDLFVWNIHKNKHADALADLAELAGEMDLVLLQEARLSSAAQEELSQAVFSSFAPGFRTRSTVTGVMTFSATEPLTNCSLQNKEPWIRTPKAIGITEFALTGSEQTLAVVNIHGVNFTLGSSDFAQQLADIHTAIEAHNGPVIVAGDFNTWNKQRIVRLEKLAEQLELTELVFPVDHRIKPFSHPLDKILVRGLKVHSATTRKVDSSDHNPLTVRLSL